MEKAAKLNEAFHNFTRASEILETYYKKLSERVQYLTQELESKNALLNKAVRAVCNGELWMPRTLITRIIEDLSGRPVSVDGADTDPAHSAVECLTPRELQVARMVHLGGNNKTIARELSISERTVKAHLSAIFRKLNIQNRLHLALFLNDIP